MTLGSAEGPAVVGGPSPEWFMLGDDLAARCWTPQFGLEDITLIISMRFSGRSFTVGVIYESTDVTMS
jgi:hypothetical protein